ARRHDVRFDLSQLSSLLNPQRIALVGASARGGPGAKMLSTIRALGFAGEVWPISQSASEIEGFACVRALDDIPHTPDCVLVAVPADGVLDVLGKAAARGIKAALVVSEGFA